MARYDVYRLAGSSDLVIDCQADLIRLETRFVVPLLPLAQAPPRSGRLNPTFDVLGEQYMMATQFAGSVRPRALGARVISLIEYDREIANALDMLLNGF